MWAVSKLNSDEATAKEAYACHVMSVNFGRSSRSELEETSEHVYYTKPPTRATQKQDQLHDDEKKDKKSKKAP